MESACDSRQFVRSTMMAVERSIFVRFSSVHSCWPGHNTYLTYGILTDDMFSYYTTLKKNLVCVATVEYNRGRRRTKDRQWSWNGNNWSLESSAAHFGGSHGSWSTTRGCGGWFGVTCLTSSPINFLQVTKYAHQKISCKTVTQIVKKHFSRFLTTFSAANIRPYS